MVDLKEAQKLLHSIIPPLKVGTVMVGKSFLLMEPQQEEDVVDGVEEEEEWLSALAQAEATSAPRVVSVILQESNSALIG